MTPKEKAKELVRKYSNYLYTKYTAKQNALICVDEIINCDSYFKILEDSKVFTKYWYEVQIEIQKL